MNRRTTKLLIPILLAACATDVRAEDHPAQAQLAKANTDEQLLRFAFRKLNFFLARNTLARMKVGGGGGRFNGKEAAIKQSEDVYVSPNVRLGAVTFGPLQALLARPVGEYVTWPSGDVPQITAAIFTGQDGTEPAHVDFSMVWRKETAYALNVRWDPNMSVAAFIRAAGIPGSGSFTRYAAYVVHVTDLEREESYKGLALFGHVQADGRRQFADVNPATGDALSYAVREERPMLPIHYFVTMKMTRTPGEFGIASSAGDGSSDTPMCSSAAGSAKWTCEGNVCCLMDGGAACCWKSLPAVNR